MKKINYEVMCYLQVYADPYVLLCYDLTENKPFILVDSDIVGGSSLFLYAPIHYIRRYVNRKISLRELAMYSGKVLLDGKKIRRDDVKTVVPDYISDDINNFLPKLCSEIETVKYVLDNIHRIIEENFTTINV